MASEKTITYKGITVAAGTVAHDMWIKKDFAALDKHIKQLDQKERDLVRRYEPTQTAE